MFAPIFQGGDDAFVFLVGKPDFGRRKFAVLRLRNNRFRQRMRETIKMCFTGTSRKFVKTQINFCR